MWETGHGSHRGSQGRGRGGSGERGQVQVQVWVSAQDDQPEKIGGMPDRDWQGLAWMQMHERGRGELREELQAWGGDAQSDQLR